MERTISITATVFSYLAFIEQSYKNKKPIELNNVSRTKINTFIKICRDLKEKGLIDYSEEAVNFEEIDENLYNAEIILKDLKVKEYEIKSPGEKVVLMLK